MIPGGHSSSAIWPAARIHETGHTTPLSGDYEDIAIRMKTNSEPCTRLSQAHSHSRHHCLAYLQRQATVSEARLVDIAYSSPLPLQLPQEDLSLQCLCSSSRRAFTGAVKFEAESPSGSDLDLVGY